MNDPADSLDPDELLRRVAVRREQIRKLKDATDQVTGEKNQEPSSDHTKIVLAQIADAYDSIDQEDSECGLKFASKSPRRSAKDPKDARRTSKIQSVSFVKEHDGNHSGEKREHVTTGASPRQAPKILKPLSASDLRSRLSITPTKPADPAELPLDQRKALFERKAGVSVKPSSCSPKKTVKTKSDENTAVNPMVRKALFVEAATKAKDPAAAKRTEPNGRSPRKQAERPAAELQERVNFFTTLVEPPKEVGVFTRTLQDKLLVQTKAWKHNDVAKKIEEQKEEDMKILRKRWELMAEEEKRAAERETVIAKAVEQKKAVPSTTKRPAPLPLPATAPSLDTTGESQPSYNLPPPVFSPTVHRAENDHPHTAVDRFKNNTVHSPLSSPPPPPPPLAFADFSSAGPAKPPRVVDLPANVADRSTNVDLRSTHSALQSPHHSNSPPPPPPPMEYMERARAMRLPEEDGLSSTGTEDSYERMDDDATYEYDARYRSQSGGSGRQSHHSRSTSRYEDYFHGEESGVQKRPVGILKSPKSPRAQHFPEFNNYSPRKEQTSGEKSSNAVPISLSDYRKSQKKEAGAKRHLIEEDQKSVDSMDSEIDRKSLMLSEYQHKIEVLHALSHQQQAILEQTTSALNLCRTAPEFQGSVERAECERLLLLAAKKQEACQTEINRLKAMVIQIQQGYSIPENGCLGQVTLTDVQLLTKEGFVEYAESDKEFMHYFFILLRHRDAVYASRLVNSVQHLQPNGLFRFPEEIVFEDLGSDVIITMEVYAVQAPRETVSHEEKFHLKQKIKPKEKGGTLKKLLPALKEGAATHMTIGAPSKHQIRPSSFGCMGSCAITLQSIQTCGGSFMLSKVPETSAIEGTVHMRIRCGVALESTEEGFLTIFEDACGPAAWHRRWCLLKDASVYMWKYPEEKDIPNSKPQILNLRWCKGQAESASSTVSPRPHTFQLMLTRPLQLGGDAREMGPYRYLIAADTKDERFMWCEKLNKVIAAIWLWIPNEKTGRN